MVTDRTVHVDGSQGEGGGQILRSALSLALVTGRPLEITAIRSRRSRPGLLRQHLTAVQAACQVAGGRALGAALGSAELRFVPGPVQPGDYRFAVGTAGSATLVLQTVLPALALASGPSHLTLEGGTHNPFAPPFDFLQLAFLPILGRMGAQVEARLERHGFYPAGGGRFTVSIRPAARLEPLVLEHRGRVRRVSARALVANLPGSIGERELATLRRALALPREATRVEEVRDSAGPGNAVVVLVESESVTEVLTGFGARGVRAETVAARVAAETKSYLDADVPVGAHLADQLLLPMALSGGGTFRTVAPTGHTRTNADVVSALLDVTVTFRQEDERAWRVEVARGEAG